MQLQRKKRKKPLVLSIIEPYSDKFVRHHLPQFLNSIYKPEYLVKNYAELIILADSYHLEDINQSMIEHLEQLTRDQSKSKHWFQYRAGRITASHFKQVVRTDPHQPSLSLLKGICYPYSQRFSTRATSWGCEHEREALLSYQTKLSSVHEGFCVSNCGFFLSMEHPFLGASPDALVQCKCCGEGVVEVKCPLCAAESSLKEAAVESRNFCLNENSSGTLQLRHDHMYYFQCNLQILVTKRKYCDFVVWSPKETHIERMMLDEKLMEGSVPKSERFWRLCVLPELLGKWYTRQEPPVNPSSSHHAHTVEEDCGQWCYCGEDKGGEMIGCDGKSCAVTWYHLDCVGMSPSSIPRGKWLCPTCHANKHKNPKLTKK